MVGPFQKKPGHFRTNIEPERIIEKYKAAQPAINVISRGPGAPIKKRGCNMQVPISHLKAPGWGKWYRQFRSWFKSRWLRISSAFKRAGDKGEAEKEDSDDDESNLLDIYGPYGPFGW